MTEAAWLRRCRELHDLQARHERTDPRALRDALAALDSLFRGAPWPVRSRYAQIAEADLVAVGQERAREIEGGSLGWPDFPLTVPRALEALAIQIRAVDDVLAASDPRYNRLPADPSSEWRSSDGGAFVIPSRRRRDLGSARRDGTSYDRRGTLMHRVVPSVLDGVPVRPVPVASLDPTSADTGIRLGAALFPGLAVVPRRTGHGFVIERVEGVDVEGAVSRQVAALADAHAVVWPELTVDDAALEHLSSELARLAFKREGCPGVVIAGSWHRGTEYSFRNVAPVLDGTGARIADYAKVACFGDREFGWEDIVRRDEILLLACDRFLASVAICKDYCDLGVIPPWHMLRMPSITR